MSYLGNLLAKATLVLVNYLGCPVQLLASLSLDAWTMGSRGDDKRVGGDRGMRAANKRVDVEGVDLRTEVAGEFGEAGDGAGNRTEVGWLGAPQAGQQRADLQAVDQGGGLRRG